MGETGITFQTIGQQIQCFYIGYLCISRPDITHKTLVDSELADEKNQYEGCPRKKQQGGKLQGGLDSAAFTGQISRLDRVGIYLIGGAGERTGV